MFGHEKVDFETMTTESFAKSKLKKGDGSSSAETKQEEKDEETELEEEDESTEHEE
jgi:hypothetical protein